MKAFYFSPEDRKLAHGDGRAVKVGVTHSIEGAPECCARGLHASERILDALNYAQSSNLYLVELDGQIDKSRDKLAATERTYLAEFDSAEVLKAFARKHALINIELIKPHCASFESYYTLVKFLETGDEALRDAAASAASAAATNTYTNAYTFDIFRDTITTRSARSAYVATHDTLATDAYTAAANASTPREKANKMLTDMIRRATGWDI
jgi:hypothetical protein